MKKWCALVLFVLALTVCSCRERYEYFSSESVRETVLEIDSVVVKGLEWMPADMRASFDSIKVYWDEFDRLCERGKFRRAYNYFESGDSESNIVLLLWCESCLDTFKDEVIFPMISEFEHAAEVTKKENIILKMENILSEGYYNSIVNGL